MRTRSISTADVASSSIPGPCAGDFGWHQGVADRFDVIAEPTGAGESGKSTVLKQMRLIYASGFSKNEKLEWKPVVYTNIIQSFRLIFDAMTELGIEFENKENEACFTLRQTGPLHKPKAQEKAPQTNPYRCLL